MRHCYVGFNVAAKRKIPLYRQSLANLTLLTVPYIRGIKLSRNEGKEETTVNNCSPMFFFWLQSLFWPCRTKVLRSSLNRMMMARQETRRTFSLYAIRLIQLYEIRMIQYIVECLSVDESVWPDILVSFVSLNKFAL